MTQKTNVNDMEFEEAMLELEGIVKTLEDSKISLKASVDLYERGILLKKRCDGILESTQLRISQITSDKNDVVSINEVSQ